MANNQRREIRFDLEAIREIARVGIRRAAAFLGWGFHTTEGEALRSLTLPGVITIAMLPDPLPEENAKEIQANYRTWIIGCCLAELDQAYGRFLVAVWNTLHWARTIGV